MSTIQEVLAVERKKLKVNVNELTRYLYQPANIEDLKSFLSKIESPVDFNIFNESRVELIKQSLRELPQHFNNPLYSEHPDWVLGYLLRSVHQSPGTVHTLMFVTCIKIMGTENQKSDWLQKCINFEVIGCYAQTELGHGSDVQNLETTATYDKLTDEFIINTPTISATKYWPGDLGVVATHALVYAQLIVNGKKNGVQSFIVPIRNPTTYEALPGIEVGDIGPKIGFNAKDNGYLIMNNIRIPKKNMLRKFTSVSNEGQIIKKGDPKVSYATMMIIRQGISTVAPKVYAQAIIIATRYSMFRKQFKDEKNQEIPIIQYQTQRDKIITRVAEFYAIITGGNQIKIISDENLKRVMEKNDFSLMNETHVCLCLGKALITETVYDGMETCRRACGGNGFSHYSGFPSLLSEYSPNITYEGENTVLYLQIARYLLKSYRHALTKKKPLGESVSYLNSYSHLLQKRIQTSKEDFQKWNMEDFRIILAQAVCQTLSQVLQKMMNKEDGQTELDIWNEVAGIDLKRLAHSHAIYYMYDHFREEVMKTKHQYNRQILTYLCLLYGCHAILHQTHGIVEGGYLTPAHFTSLLRLKEHLLQKLRPELIGLVDAFAIPDKLIRSALAKGDPYQNYLDLARKNKLNDHVPDSVRIMKEGMPKALAKWANQPKL